MPSADAAVDRDLGYSREGRGGVTKSAALFLPHTASRERPTCACQPNEREGSSRGVRQKGTPPRGASRVRCVEDCIKWQQEVRSVAEVVSINRPQRVRPSVYAEYEGAGGGGRGEVARHASRVGVHVSSNRPTCAPTRLNEGLRTIVGRPESRKQELSTEKSSDHRIQCQRPKLVIEFCLEDQR